MNEKQYVLSIEPSILELLGPSLYTNIYYILAELIANSYDADAENVYIIINKNRIIVEDDGNGMSYENGEIQKYLNVAEVSRTNEEDSFTGRFGRRKMGRKGVGKLAALSISENVYIKTISNGEKSGFILSRHVGKDKLLAPITNDEISFVYVKEHGTAVEMVDPQYKLHSSDKAIKRNLLKIFPLVDKDFRIHIIQGKNHMIIDSFNSEIVKELCALITLGDDFSYLAGLFSTIYEAKRNSLVSQKPTHTIPIAMTNCYDISQEYIMKIDGWLGSYTSTRGRKAELTDFPDNFISIYANKKLGEFNILPVIGQNKLNEVYVVGQLHIDIFEQSELPDMALSNRQGYKTDDPRYQKLLIYARKTLLPEILKMREVYVSEKNKEKKQQALSKQQLREAEFTRRVETFRSETSSNASKRIIDQFGKADYRQEDTINHIISEEINKHSPQLGIKSKIDAPKKKILISQTLKDKDLADIVYNMLIYNNVPPEDIIYTNCDNEVCRVPEGDTGKSGVYNYLRTFFVDSYSTDKIYVVFITSCDSKVSWGALIEVGAAWITQNEHKIFNIHDFRPEHPLDDEAQWHTSERDSNGEICMTNLRIDMFCTKIEYICDKLNYLKRSREENINRLTTMVVLVD